MRFTPIPMVVPLTAEEVELIKKFGRLRHDNARSAGTVDRLACNHDRVTNDIQAFAAEVSFCKIAGTQPYYDAKRHDFDTVLPSGTTVDVKSTHRPNGNLLVHAKASHVADVYVLMIGTLENGFAYYGYAHRDFVFRTANIQPHLKDSPYMVKRRDLNPALPE